MVDTLTPAPEPDRFEHETPLRAFTEWNETGLYAIGKGLRPSPKHLPVYLDAIERKEGWVLVQMLLDNHGVFRSAIFRRDPAKVVDTIEYHGVTPFNPRSGKPHPFEAGYTPSPQDGRDIYEALADEIRAQADDPVNPKHYGGTACAEIGERLTANCYQVLKYCWRLGEKDDPKIELGKAIWYARRELALGLPRSRGHGQLPGMKQAFVIERTRGNRWRREIGLLVWDMCYGFGTATHWLERAEELSDVLEVKLREISAETPCTTGLTL